MKPQGKASAITRGVGDAYVPGSGDDGYAVAHYDLAITYRPTSNRLEGHAEIQARAARPITRFGLDLSGLAVSKVTVDGRRPKKYGQIGSKLVITLDAPVEEGASFHVAVTYHGRPRPVASRWGDVGWEELREGALVASEPNGAPSWFPCNDHPSNKATYRIAVTTDTPFTAVANGDLLEQHTHASTRTWVYEQSEPMASYLATVQIGHYDIHDLPSSTVPQRIALPGRLGKLAALDFGRQDRMMTLFTELFGPYPFGAYTIVVTDDPLEIPLEAQGLSIFGANHIDGLRMHERLVAHELAHQWFGNSLTVANWSDIWLNEGFACYAEWLWSERAREQSADGHAARHWKQLEQLPQDLLLGDPGPDLMFDDRLYKRGALTLHALRRTIGDTAFFDVMRQWVADNRHGSVTTTGFLDHVTTQAGLRARGLLYSWLFETRLPALPEGQGHRRA